MSIRDSDWDRLQNDKKTMNAKNCDHWIDGYYDDEMSTVYREEYTRKKSVAKQIIRSNVKNKDHWIDGVCFSDDDRQRMKEFATRQSMSLSPSSKRTSTVTKHQNERTSQEIIQATEAMARKHKNSADWHKRQLRSSYKTMHEREEKSKKLKVIILELKNELKGTKRKFNDLKAQKSTNPNAENGDYASLQQQNEQLLKNLIAKDNEVQFFKNALSAKLNEQRYKESLKKDKNEIKKLLKTTMSKNKTLTQEIDNKNGTIERMNSSQSAMADHLVVKLKELRSETSLNISDSNRRLLKSMKKNKLLTRKLNKKCNENRRLSNDISECRRTSIENDQNLESLKDECKKSNNDIRKHWNTINDLKETLKKNEILNKKLSKNLKNKCNENDKLTQGALDLWKEINALKIKSNENERNSLDEIEKLSQAKEIMHKREVEMLAAWQVTKKQLSSMGKCFHNLEAENKKMRHFENANRLLSKELSDVKAYNEELESSFSESVKVKELLSGTVSSLQSSMEEQKSELDEVRKSELEYQSIAGLRMEQMNELRESMESIKNDKEQYKNKLILSEDEMNKKLEKINHKKQMLSKRIKKIEQKCEKKDNEFGDLKKKHLSMIERKDEIIENLKKTQNCIKAKLHKSERLSIVNMNDLKQRLIESIKENKSLLNEISENLDENEKIKEQIHEIGAMNNELMKDTKKMSKIEQKLREKNIAFEILMSEINLVKENCKRLEFDKDMLQMDNKQLKNALKNAENSMNAFGAEMITLIGQRDTMQNEMGNNLDQMKMSEMQNSQNNERMIKKLKEKDEKMMEKEMEWMQQKQELKHQIVQNETEKNEKIYELQCCVQELKENNERIMSLEREIYSLQFELKQKNGNAVEQQMEIDELEQRLLKSEKLKNEWMREKHLLQTQIKNSENEKMSQIIAKEQFVDEEVAYLDDDIMRLKQELNKKQKNDNERKREMNAVRNELNDILQYDVTNIMSY